MTQQQTYSIQEKDMMRRNQIVLYVLSFVTILTVLSTIMTLEDKMLVALTVFLVVSVAISHYLHFKKIAIFQLKYIVLATAAIFTVCTIITTPASSNMLALYYVLVLVAVYSDKWLLRGGIVLAFVVLAYMLTAQADVFLVDGNDPFTYILYLLLISSLLYALQKISHFYIEQMNEAQQASTALAQQQQQQSEDLAQLMERITRQITTISDHGNNNQKSLNEMGKVFQEIGHGATVQSTETHDISEAINGMNTMIATMNGKIQLLESEASDSAQLSRTGEQESTKLMTTISAFRSEIDDMAEDLSELLTQLEGINEFSTAITDIADETNLLSLNASIEAARAGEHGKGFAVVASEIRNLSDNTSKSAQKITERLKDVSAQNNIMHARMTQVAERMESSFTMTERTNQAFTQMRSAVETFKQLAEESSHLINEVQQNAETIGRAGGELAAVTEQSTASIQEVTATLEIAIRSNEDIFDDLEELDQMAKQA